MQLNIKKVIYYFETQNINKPCKTKTHILIKHAICKNDIVENTSLVLFVFSWNKEIIIIIKTQIKCTFWQV